MVKFLINKFFKTIDGISLRDLNIHSLREQLCIVSQEPMLFDFTIKENITYGMQHEVSFEEIKQAATLANIHSFIQSLPMNYDTKVGGQLCLKSFCKETNF